MARSRENGGSGQADPGGEKTPAVEHEKSLLEEVGGTEER
jgi:hypothetical protein